MRPAFAGPAANTTRRHLIGAGLGLAVTAISPVGRVLAAAATEAGAPHVLHAQTVALRPGGRNEAPTPVMTFEGSLPGPLLRVTRGAMLNVRLQNDLAVPTTIHWHGIRGPDRMDGVPNLTQPSVAPGAAFDYRFAPPDAGTFWYHAGGEPQPHGLYGALLVDDAEPIDADREFVLIFDRWPRPDAASTPHDAGDITVNGLRAPSLPVRTNERVRLRIINAAADLLALTVDQHAALVAGIDGQPAEPFEARDARVVLGPGNRVDLIVDARLAPGTTTPLVVETASGRGAAARLAYAEGGPARAQPRTDTPRLPANRLPDRIEFRGALRHTLTAAGERGRPREHAPEAATMGFGAPAFTVARGRTVMLALVNPTRSVCVVHVHGHSFRLLDALDDGWKPFWLDTLVIAAGQTMRIAFVADNPGRWQIERRALGTSDVEPPIWFAVT